MIRSGRQRRADFQKVVERDVGLERIRLAFGRHNVRLLDVKFGGILDDDDALVVGNEVGQYPQKRRLSGPRSATDKQRLSAANLLAQEVCKRPRQRAASDQVIDGVMAAGELSDDRVAGAGRTTGGITAASRLPSGSCACR